MALVATST
jgi:hypothetical protein